MTFTYLPNLVTLPLNKMLVAGHSIAAGPALTYTSHTASPTGRLAQLLGVTETNFGVSATGLLADNSKAWSPVLTGTGSWVNTMQNGLATIYGTLSSTLSTGAGITSLPVNALVANIPFSGIVVTLDDQVGHTQNWTTTAAANAGASSLAVTSQTPNFAFPANTTIVKLSGTINRSRAPYLSPVQVAYLMFGINDVSKWGPCNTAFFNSWTPVMKALVDYLRCGAIYEDNDAKVTLTGFNARTTGTTTCQGTGYSNTTTANSTAQFTIPSDFDGQAVIYGGLATTNAFATYTATINGVVVAQFSSANMCASSVFGGSAPQLPFTMRIPSTAPGFVPGATIVVTVTNIAFVGYCDWWGIESNPAPIVVIGDTLRPPNYTYANGNPYVPTDADILAINAANQTLAASYADGRVITDGADTLINKGGGWIVSVHPDERSSAQIALHTKNLIINQFGNVADLSLLGAA